MAKSFYNSYDHHKHNNHQTRTLEITIISGEELKKNSFVTVRSDPDNFRSTAVDEEGGTHPNWNEKLFLEVPANSPPSFTIEVRRKTMFGHKIIGSVLVPATDFSGGYVPANRLHFLSYRLRSPRGERNGIINVSVRMKGQDVDTCTLGIPVERSSQFGGSGVVTGVPVWSLQHNNNMESSFQRKIRLGQTCA